MTSCMSSKIKDHSDRKHALLSASGSSRWLSCTPSARFEENFEKTTSVYASEGTLAHEFADLELSKFADKVTDKEYEARIQELRSHELYSKEMEPQVAKYVEAVKEDYYESLVLYPNETILEVEKRLDFSHVVPEGFGTGDNAIVNPTHLKVIDLKYGKGIRVYAEDNPQLKLYALGSLRSWDLFYSIETITLVIIQPRLDHYSSWSISTEDLLDWAETYVKPRAQMAWNGEGEKVAGDHCRWCAAKVRCPKLYDEAMEAATYDFSDGSQMTDDEIIEIYEKIDMFKSWFKAIDEYMLDEAKKGHKFDGYKLVTGRSNSKWSDESNVSSKLKELGYIDDDIFNFKIKGIGDIKNLMSVDKFNKEIKPLVIKPPGRPTLSKDNDERTALGFESAVEDFS